MANKNNSIDENKQASITKAQLEQMEKAYIVVLDSLDEGSEQFMELLRLTHGEHTDQVMDLRALLNARFIVLRNFF
ncbi:MAG: hypothetical protein HQL12_09630 [Candidatus Omnitrophica bacterium]|nr:hypothetical protein [Candidatus Omnitrophota bacterium]